jgi:diadenosine tetraphosphatase ApaH/serine/threonine PP2A family protein phosphatase
VELEMLSNLELEAVRTNCLLVHASPYEPDQWHYVLTLTEAGVAFEHLEQRICFNGHSHIPLIFSQSEDGAVHGKAGHDFDPLEENRYIINVGSVGQPRDSDPRACYVLFDPDDMAVTYRRVEYDIKAAQTKMIRARLPQMLIERLEVGR